MDKYQLPLQQRLKDKLSLLPVNTNEKLVIIIATTDENHKIYIPQLLCRYLSWLSISTKGNRINY